MTGQISDANEWSKVPRSTPMENLIRQHGDFVSNALRDAQPMQANKRINDMPSFSHDMVNVCPEREVTTHCYTKIVSGVMPRNRSTADTVIYSY